jgi:hypothetical protein
MGVMFVVDLIRKEEIVLDLEVLLKGVILSKHYKSHEESLLAL